MSGHDERYLDAEVEAADAERVRRARYQDEPHSPTQEGCSHPARYRSRSGAECSICGSQKFDGRWRYLKRAWLSYYLDGGVRPEDIG